MPKVGKTLSAKFVVLPNELKGKKNGEETLHTLYLRVSHGRPGLQFPIVPKKLVPIDFEETNELRVLKEKILSMLKIEMEDFEHLHSLNGFADRYKIYIQNMSDYVSTFTYPEIKNSLLRIKPDDVDYYWMVTEFFKGVDLSLQDKTLTVFDFLFDPKKTRKTLKKTDTSIFEAVSNRVIQERGLFKNFFAS